MRCGLFGVHVELLVGLVVLLVGLMMLSVGLVVQEKRAHCDLALTLEHYVLLCGHKAHSCRERFVG